MTIRHCFQKSSQNAVTHSLTIAYAYT